MSVDACLGVVGCVCLLNLPACQSEIKHVTVNDIPYVRGPDPLSSSKVSLQQT